MEDSSSFALIGGCTCQYAHTNNAESYSYELFIKDWGDKCNLLEVLNFVSTTVKTFDIELLTIGWANTLQANGLFCLA